jgi:hypothetical protein
MSTAKSIFQASIESLAKTANWLIVAIKPEQSVMVSFPSFSMETE